MKGKKMLCMPIIAMLLFSGISAVGATFTEKPWVPGVGGPIWLYVTDYEFEDSADLICTYFNVSVKLYNCTAENVEAQGRVAGLGVWFFKLQYNTTLLDAVRIYNTSDTERCVDWGPEDTVGYNASGPPNIKDSEGLVQVGATYNVGEEMNSTDATLVKIKFHITYAPAQLIGANNTVSCVLDLKEPSIGDRWGDPLSVTLDDGSYTYKRLELVPSAPVADFTWSPTIVFECDTVTLTDTSTPGTDATIKSWKWTITNGTGNATLTGLDNASSTTFHCDAAGTIYVTLNVTNDPFNLSDDETKEIEQREVVGCMIDVYTGPDRFWGSDQTTTYVGKGLDEKCDAFAPGDNMTLYAEVTFNKAPVEGVLVTFEMVWEMYIDWQEGDNWTISYPDPGSVAVRSAYTNASGIAEVVYRIPLVNYTGKWQVVATCVVASVEQKDTMKFDVGNLITIVYVEVLGTGIFERGSDYIEVKVYAKNIAWTSKSVTFVITAYDVNDVPVGQKVHTNTYAGGAYCSPANLYPTWYSAILVPDWAYVGVGKVYVNALTDLPSQSGIAYCIEKSDTIEITFV